MFPVVVSEIHIQLRLPEILIWKLENAGSQSETESWLSNILAFMLLGMIYYSSDWPRNIHNQVVNRDLSIAVLRTFISKRKEEQTARWNKKAEARKTVPEDAKSEQVPEPECSPHNEEANGEEHEVAADSSKDEPGDGSVTTNSAGNGDRREVKPPKILEVKKNFHCIINCPFGHVCCHIYSFFSFSLDIAFFLRFHY